jgi:predicted dehydrogenase
MTLCDKTHRRTFLRRGVCAAAMAVAAPQFVPGRVLGLAGAPGANEQIVVGIVGMGTRGRALVRNIPACGRLAAICDADSGRTAAALAEFQANWKVYDDYRKLFEQKDLNAVIVCPCCHHHVHAGILACQAGLDVYVEKPLSIYVAEGRALVNAARKYKRVVQTGTQQRTMEMDRFACELVRDGGIGRVRVVECVNQRGPSPYPPAGLPEEPIPAGVNWDVWQGPAPVHPFNKLLFTRRMERLGRTWWGAWRDYSTGESGQIHSHGLDMVQYALGADESGPVEYRLIEEGPAGRVDFRYANGVEVQLKLSRGPACGAIFIGEKCKIEINRNKFTTNPKDFVTGGPDPEMAKKWSGTLGGDSIARGHMQNWFDCIKSRRKPNADVEIGHRTATICNVIDIARQLGQVGQTLQWDPAAERFTNSPQGNRLLDRPRRKGWELPAA